MHVRLVTRPRLRDDIVHELARLIASGEVDPSERLKENELAERLGVSRTPLREALLMLERDGLVVSEVNKGFRVAPVSERRVRELYPILGSLEGLAVREGLAELRRRAGELQALNRRIEAARTGAKRHTLDRAFHEALWAGSANVALVKMLRALWLQAQQVDGASDRGMANLEGSVAEHAAIVDAIARGDGDAAAKRLGQHWRGGIEVVVGWLRRVTVVAIALCAVGARAEATLEATPCPVKAAAGVECFTLTVPENRANPASRTIGVPVARLRSPAAHPAEPMVLIVGGPGVSSLRDGLDPARQFYAAERDVILFEQRGTRFATPELPCPAWDGAKTVVQQRAAATTCAAQLRAAGVDLDGYDTQAIVADLVDLHRLLGGTPLNLFGISYGTRVALEVLRVAPQAVHAVVLDSTLPPDVRYDEMSVEATLRSLNRVLDQCSVDVACRAKYPDLRARWQVALAKSSRTRDLIGVVAESLEDASAIVGVPKLIDAIARGDLTSVDARLARASGPSSLMWGQRLAIWCREEAPITKPAWKHPELREWNTVAFDPSVCQAWQGRKASGARAQPTPVRSEVPVLIFAGEYDPATPPEWGRHALATLPHGFFLEVPGESHVAANRACAAGIARAFLRDPTRLADTSCLSQAPAPVFP